MNRIKFLREEQKMTQQELADKIDGAKSSIAMYEKGDRKPSLEILVKLSEIFNCSIDYILCKSDIRNPEKVDINYIDIAFASGIKGLNKENQEIAKNIIEGLLAKQKNEENKGDKNNA